VGNFYACYFNPSAMVSSNLVPTLTTSLANSSKNSLSWGGKKVDGVFMVSGIFSSCYLNMFIPKRVAFVNRALYSYIARL
jgi:hypothetical protein